MFPQELKFSKGSVWVQAIQINVFNPSTKKHDGGRWLVYFNFGISAQFIGEILKDSGSNPMIWDNDTDGIEYAKERFRKLLD